VLLGGCSGSDEGDEPPVTAPESARVDRGTPTFSNPKVITNPLFPAGSVTQAVLLGSEGKKRLRFEVALLPETKTIDWDGKRVETVVSQFVGYSDGRIAEVARDFFAQADDGSVWYFGEDVANYEDGKPVDTEGTWLAGKDGPPGMIMPAAPNVGDVYRPENIPGLVFEEVTVKATGQTVDGPRGRVDGAVLVQEKLMDGTVEDKTFAPGYGEFHARVENEEEDYTMAVAAPTDATPGPVPRPLSILFAGVEELLRLGEGRPMQEEASATADNMAKAWRQYTSAPLPGLLRPEMDGAMAALGKAVADKKVPGIHEAAIQVGQTALDLQLQFRPPTEVDRDRLYFWSRQLALDGEAHDGDAVAGDLVAIDAIWARSSHGFGFGREAAEPFLLVLRQRVQAKKLDSAANDAKAFGDFVRER
jgi:hypothetical protein